MRKKQSKKQLRGSKFTLSQNMILLLAVSAVAGLLAGALIAYLAMPKVKDIRYGVASVGEIKAAKDVIRKEFADDATKCTDPTDPVRPADRVEIFDKYLKVNKYGNRAVIRGCGDVDSLLAKDPLTGKWVRSAVNVALDARANPVWQVECMIDDITVADTVTRSENSSIDTTNLVLCRQLKENELIEKILQSTFKKDGMDLTDKDIKEYIKGAEEFSTM